MESYLRKKIRCLNLDIKSKVNNKNKFKFEIYIENKNSFDIFDIDIKSSIPICFQYIEKTLCIDDIQFYDFMGITNMHLDNLYVGEKIKLSYELEKVAMFKFNYIDVEIIYRDDKEIYSEIETKVIEEKALNTEYEPKEQKLEVIKKATCNSAIISEIISYEISVKNISEELVRNIEIVDIQGTEVEIVGESIYLNNKPIDISSLSKGIYLKYLEKNQSAHIKFNVKILDRGINATIANKIRVSYDYELEGTEIYMTDEVLSEELKVYKSQLEIEKTANKETIILGEEIVFRIDIKNLGEVDCYSISLYEVLSEEIEFIVGSFYRDYDNINISTLENGINIGNLLKGKSLTLYYKVLVKKICSTGFINSQISADYKYKCDMKSPIKFLKVEKKQFKIEATNPGFTEFEIENNFIIEDGCAEIIDISEDIEIEDNYIIKTATGRSLNGEIMNLYKLVVIGYLNLYLEYAHRKESEEVYIKKEKQRFVEIIVLAEDYKVGTGISVKGSSKNIYYKKINDRKILYKNSIIVEAIVKEF